MSMNDGSIRSFLTISAILVGAGAAWSARAASGNIGLEFPTGAGVLGNAEMVSVGLPDVVQSSGDPRVLVQQQQTNDPVIWTEHTSGGWLGITNTVQLSSDVVEAVVVDVTPARFNTASGLPPAGSSPVPDDNDAEAEWMLHRYVTMQVPVRYKGAITNTHVVLAARGGTYDSNGDGQPDYVHEQVGRDLVDAAVGDYYFLFGLYPFVLPPDQADGSEWEDYGLALSLAASGAGQPTVYLQEYAAFKVVGSTATSAWGGEFEVEELRSITSALTGGP